MSIKTGQAYNNALERLNKEYSDKMTQWRNDYKNDLTGDAATLARSEINT